MPCHGSPRGAKEIRTPDPLDAIEMRYQLRYSPIETTPVYCRRPALSVQAAKSLRLRKPHGRRQHGACPIARHAVTGALEGRGGGADANQPRAPRLDAAETRVTGAAILCSRRDGARRLMLTAVEFASVSDVARVGSRRGERSQGRRGSNPQHTWFWRPGLFRLSYTPMCCCRTKKAACRCLRGGSCVYRPAGPLARNHLTGDALVFGQHGCARV